MEYGRRNVYTYVYELISLLTIVKNEEKIRQHSIIHVEFGLCSMTVIIVKTKGDLEKRKK